MSAQAWRRTTSLRCVVSVIWLYFGVTTAPASDTVEAATQEEANVIIGYVSGKSGVCIDKNLSTGPDYIEHLTRFRTNYLYELKAGILKTKLPAIALGPAVIGIDQLRRHRSAIPVDRTSCEWTFSFSRPAIADDSAFMFVNHEGYTLRVAMKRNRKTWLEEITETIIYMPNERNYLRPKPKLIVDEQSPLFMIGIEK